MATEQTKINLHLVSDSSGETVNAVAMAAIVQFENIAVKEYIWPLVRTIEQVDKILEMLKKDATGIVVHTMIAGEVQAYLTKECAKLNIPCICPIDHLTNVISSYLNIIPTRNTHGKTTMGQEYFAKIENINFAIKHDDGQYLEEYNHADIVILGVSRTSKSPTSLYLAQRGYRVANIPIVPLIDINIVHLKTPLLVGFIIDPELLTKIRSARLNGLIRNQPNANEYDSIANNYISIEKVREELQYAKNFFNTHNINIINVTRKAIEEIAAEIINLFCDQKSKNRAHNIIL